MNADFIVPGAFCGADIEPGVFHAAYWPLPPEPVDESTTPTEPAPDGSELA